MSTIAKGETTISPVNDAYTVLLTPSSCSISAGFDGSNPLLDHANGVITIKRGTREVPFTVNNYDVSDSGIVVSISSQSETVKQFSISKIPTTVLDGNIKFTLTTEDGFNYSTEVTFSFNVVRESTMLDWIQDWESNKTSIGNSYVITPKIFVGKNVPDGADMGLTGVYIGPAGVTGNSTGIFGYKNSNEIFHINEDGGFIGGWTFNQAGMQSGNGVVNILSEGTIYATNAESETPHWGLYSDGHAVFANGRVKFGLDGSAEFDGTIKSSAGLIGGWAIYENMLYSNRVFIDAAHGFIGIDASGLQAMDSITESPVFPATPDGGIKMWYNSAVDFGFAAWRMSKKVFQLGSTNFIAGWSFDNDAIWSGQKNNTASGYSTEGITIGSNGLRGIKWYIDANGDISFMGGKISFSSVNDGGEIVGWKLNNKRLSTDKIALVSDETTAGIFLSANQYASFNSRVAESFESFIDSYGGIYFKVKPDSADLAAYDLNGKRIFKIKSNGVSHIAGWNFDNTTLYTGLAAATTGFAKTGEITLGPTGLRGFQWRLENDGSGGLAGDKIKWDEFGNLTVDAQISANNITAGTISTASVICEGKWKLDQEGTGFLANGNITWDDSGNTTLKSITVQSGKIAGFDVSGTSLTNAGFDNDACIIFRNDKCKVFGAMGGNTMPISSGLRAVARFENEDSTNSWYSRNIALLLSAKNGTYNHAFLGNGNGTLDGWIAGFRFDRFTLTNANTIYSDFVNLNKNNRWICKSVDKNSGIALPRLSEVQQALAIGYDTPFCVDLYILGDIGSNAFSIYGRTNKNGPNGPDGKPTHPWSSTQYPVLVHWDGGYWESQPVGPGDCWHVWLVYDPNETQTLSGFSCKYTARVISKQA